MKIVEENIAGWSGYRLNAGDISLGFVPQLGGRIMSLLFKGEELLYVHGPDQGKTFSGEKTGDLRAFKKHFGLHPFGGDKTWVAPEHDWWEKSPPFDLDAGVYGFSSDDGVIVMKSPVCRETGLVIVRRISVSGAGVISLEEELQNASSREVTKGIWNVTQLCKPFETFFPAVLQDVRSYHIKDPTLPKPGVMPRECEGWVGLPCDGNECYKFGVVLKEGKVLSLSPSKSGLIAFARIFPVDSTRAYAHGSVVEIFNSSLYPYGEVEIHSPLHRIPAGARVTFSQKWALQSFSLKDPFQIIVRELFRRFN